MSTAIRNGFSLKAYEPSDLNAVIDIEYQCYQYPWSRNIFQQCYTMGYSMQLALSCNIISGYCVMSTAMREAHILNLCVAPSLQNQGIATSLMHHVINEARKRNCQRMFLEVRISNIAAQQLYSRLGFNQIGERRNYYRRGFGREDALVLAKELVSLYQPE